MDFFDLHCDSLVKAYSERKSLFDGEMHINLKKAGYIKNYKQCFAVWIDDEFKGGSAFSFCVELIDFYHHELSNLHKKGITNLTTFLTIENGSALMGDIEKISFFKKRGVKMITLTWNGENELGYGVGSDSEKGLKKFAKKAIEVMENEGITVDISHLNEQGFKDVVSVAARPFVASHSGCDAVLNHKRNLKDWQIKEIISSGGLIGIPFCKNFIGGGKQMVREHISHILSLGGENSVALGGDFDGCETETELSGIEKMQDLYAFLCESDMGREITDKVFYLNAEKFFQSQ